MLTCRFHSRASADNGRLAAAGPPWPTPRHLTTTRKMHASTLTALSPLDGRYAAKVDALRPLAVANSA